MGESRRRPGQRVPPDEIDRFVAERLSGRTRAEACRVVGVSPSWAANFERERLDPSIRARLPKDRRGRPITGDVAAPLVARPLAAEALTSEAQRSLEDFGFFRVRFFGRVPSPWQEEAAYTIRDLLASPDKEFVVLNCPPGAGKSTLLHDVMCWLIARDRSVRLLYGSRTQTQASLYSNRVRKSLERTSPMIAKEEEAKRGLAVDATSTLIDDFGPFRPPTYTEIWRREQFTVVQARETPTDEKESTVTAFGMDSGQLGHRVNGIFWDDLVDRSTVKTQAALETQRMWWEDEGETRLEPGGLLVLCGQRIAASDLYRHCLDMDAWSLLDAEEDPDGGDMESRPKKYTHIKYPAHFEERCEKVHSPAKAEPYPNGCLLDPQRIPWRELQAVRGAREQKFRVLYQQEDVDPASVLVPPVWINGGSDPESGEVFPGCWDDERAVCELPKGLAGPLISVATVDPSPTKYWAILWLVHQPSTGLTFLMDVDRRTLEASTFLDYNAQDGVFYGVMEDWHNRAKLLGVPITHWIVEVNAAQRFMLQYEHFKNWMRTRGVRVIGHNTASNKADPEYGFEATLQPAFRRGLLRIPGKHDLHTRQRTVPLVLEATHYPESPTDDCLMALWFFFYKLPHIVSRDPSEMPRRVVPSWVRPAAV